MNIYWLNKDNVKLSFKITINIHTSMYAKGGQIMGVNLRGKHFLAIEDFEPSEIRYLLDLSHQLKIEKQSGISQKRFEGKNLLMLFEMGSTRTRCAFETSAQDLGMGTTYLANSHFGIRETIKDSMRVFAGMYDVIMYRGEGHEQLKEMASYSKVPVINGFTAYQHPTQMLADFMTLEEEWGKYGFRGKKFGYVGNGAYGVAFAYAVMCGMLGMDFIFVGPEDSGLTDEEREIVKGLFKKYSPNNTFEESTNSDDVKGCHVLSTENWAYFQGPVEEWVDGINKFRKYQVNAELIAKTGVEDTIVMHMLPGSHNCDHEFGRRLQEQLDPEIAEFVKGGFEVTDEIFEKNSHIIFREAENRQHTIKAVMHAVVGV